MLDFKPPGHIFLGVSIDSLDQNNLVENERAVAGELICSVIDH